MLNYLLNKSEVVGTADGLRTAYRAKRLRLVMTGPVTWLGSLLLGHSITRQRLTLATVSAQERRSYIPRDMALSLLQASHEQHMEDHHRAELDDAPTPRAMGSRVYTGAWTITGPAFMEGFRWGRGFDYHFITGFLDALGRHFLRRITFRLPRAAPRPHPLGDPARLVIVGDWGTGEGAALKVAAQMDRSIREATGREVHVIHLGDVYYAGTRWEATTRFLAHWPVPRDSSTVKSWCLNGNHDMYSAGEGLFNEILTDSRFNAQVTVSDRPTSEFVLTNEHWTIAGFDTSASFRATDTRGGHGHLGRRQRRRLRALGRAQHGSRSERKRLMLLTHHQPITLSAAGGVLEEAELMAATDPLRSGGGIDAWFWGHEHRLVCFGSYEGIGYATCTGHGAVLEEPAIDSPAADLTRRPLEYTDTFDDSDGFTWRTPGFAVVDVDGPEAAVTYLDQDGGRWREPDHLRRER